MQVETAERMEAEIQEYLKKTKIKVKKEDYKFGIVRSERRLGGHVAHCSCGNIFPATRYSVASISCEQCRNEYFVDATGKSHYRFTIPYLGLIHKTHTGFKIKRTNLSIVATAKELIPIQENLVRTIEFDMVKKVLKVWRDEELEYDAHNVELRRSIDVINQRLMTNVEESALWRFIETDVSRDIYKVGIHYQRRGVPSILRSLARLLHPENEWVQILANAGITKVERFIERRSYYNQNKAPCIFTEETKPHRILGVPKFMMTYIREDHSIDVDVLREMQGHLGKVDAGLLKEIMSIVKDEGEIKELSSSLEAIMNIHIDYGYTNLRKLILYLFRETKLTQGIDSARDSTTLLRDYIRMSRALDVEWEKYPKSLKKVHDVVMLNYKLLNQNDRMQKLFGQSVQKVSYQHLAYENKKEQFIMVLPSTPQDLAREGNELSHCISSYCTAVVDDKCKLVFMRDKENPEQPLVSIEVRGFNIRQAKGASNRSTTPEEKEFIKRWAEEKGLVENYY